MDEPTTPLSTHETDRLFALIKRLRAEGLAILYISHRMDEIDELADEVTVLRDGTYVGTLTRAELSRDTLVKMMVGRDLGLLPPRNTRAFTPAQRCAHCAVKHMSDGHRVRDCSFELHSGEVLGLAGLVGAGRTELARLIFGADPRTGGEVQMGTSTLKIEQPLDAIRSGILYLTEDRKGEGLFLDLSVRDNINVMVCPLDAKGGGVMDGRRAFERARDAIKQLSIRVASPRVNVGSLSGGNQQKVLLARLLELKPKVLILDEHDARRRHRRQERDIPSDRRAGAPRRRRARDLERAGRSGRRLRPRDRDARGPPGRRGRRRHRYCDHPGKHRGTCHGRHLRQRPDRALTLAPTHSGDSP